MDDIGWRLRQCRESKGLSLTKMAQAANFNKGYLSKVERGLRPAPMNLVRAYDRVLEAGGELISVLISTALVPAQDPEIADETWSLVLEPTGETRYLPTGLPTDGVLASTRFAANSSIIDEHSLAVYRSQLEQFRLQGHVTSPAQVLPGLIAYTNVLRALVHNHPEPDLVILAARFMEYTGWMCQEAGKEELARSWTTKAVYLTATVGDTTLHSYSLVRAAEIALYTHDGVSMIDLARRAKAAPEATAAIRSLAAQREAQGYALLGEAHSAEAALDEASHWQEIATAEAVTSFGSGSLVDPVAMARGWALHDLDRSQDALDLLTMEVDRIPATAVRSRVRFGVRLALAHAEVGDIDGCCVRLESLATDTLRVDSATVRVDLRLLMRVLSKHASYSRVRDIDPHLRAALHVVHV